MKDEFQVIYVHKCEGGSPDGFKVLLLMQYLCFIDQLAHWLSLVQLHR